MLYVDSIKVETELQSVLLLFASIYREKEVLETVEQRILVNASVSDRFYSQIRVDPGVKVQLADVSISEQAFLPRLIVIIMYLVVLRRDERNWSEIVQIPFNLLLKFKTHKGGIDWQSAVFTVVLIYQAPLNAYLPGCAAVMPFIIQTKQTVRSFRLGLFEQTKCVFIYISLVHNKALALR